MPSATSVVKKVQKPPLLKTIQKMWQADRKLVIQYVIVGGGTITLVLAIIIPLAFKVLSMKTKLRELDVQVQSAKARAGKIPELKKLLEQYQKEIETAEKRFFNIKALDQLIGTLSKMAADAQVLMVGSRPLTDRPQQFPDPYNKKYLTASYELVLEGGYHQIGKLIASIEQGEYLLSVREIAIRPSSGRQADKLQCVLQVDAHVRAPQGV